MDFAVGRTSGYPTQNQFLDAEGIGGAEKAPTLLNERMLSSINIIGNFSVFWKSSLLRRFSSSILSFRMFFSFGAQSK